MASSLLATSSKRSEPTRLTARHCATCPGCATRHSIAPKNGGEFGPIIESELGAYIATLHGMSNKARLACAISLLGSFSALPQASANCAMPVSYRARVDANTVTIEPLNFGERGCPDSSGMLRENVRTGELVKLADYCSGVTKPGTASESASSAAYVDECVPAGTYRYGFAKPYECHPSSCSTNYFTEAEVESSLAGSCTRSSENRAPTAATSKPWSANETICAYTARPNPATGGVGNTSVPSGGTPGIIGTDGIGGFRPAESKRAVAGTAGALAMGGSGAVQSTHPTIVAGGAVGTGSSRATNTSTQAVATGGAVGTGSSRVAETSTHPTLGTGGKTTAPASGSGASVSSEPLQPRPLETGNDSDSGCSMSGPQGTTTVVAINLATILVGLMLGRRRSRQNGR